MIWLSNIRNTIWQIIFIIKLFIIITKGKECADNPELKKILNGYLVDANKNDLEGTWMDVYISTEDIDDLEASYSIIKEGVVKNSDTLHVESKEIIKNGGKEITYKEKIFTTAEKGIFHWTGKYDDGTQFKRIMYLFYVDKNVIAHYSCDSEQTLEEGWDILIAVNSSKRMAIKAQSSPPNDVQISKKKALEKLVKLKEESERYKKNINSQFGFMGEFCEVDLQKLQPSED